MIDGYGVNSHSIKSPLSILDVLLTTQLTSVVNLKVFHNGEQNEQVICLTRCCSWGYYCPDEPGQPRSYLSTEPATGIDFADWILEENFPYRFGILVTMSNQQEIENCFIWGYIAVFLRDDG